MKVSVIIPVYNGRDRLGRCLESIFSGLPSGELEVIAVDDGSTDGTAEWLDQEAAREPRLRVFHQKNSGSGPARNLGIANATGELLYFPDADDELLPGGLELFCAAFEDESVDIAVSSYINCDETGKRTSAAASESFTLSGDELRRSFHKMLMPEPGREWLRLLIGAPWNKMFRAKTVREYGIEYPPLRRNQDEVFNMRCMDRARAIRYIEGETYLYYTNSMTVAWRKFPFDYDKIALALLDFRVDISSRWEAEDRQAVLDYFAREFKNAAFFAILCAVNPSREKTAGERIKKIADIRREYLSQFKPGGRLSSCKPYPGMKLVPPIARYFRAKQQAARLAKG